MSLKKIGPRTEAVHLHWLLSGRGPFEVISGEISASIDGPEIIMLRISCGKVEVDVPIGWALAIDLAKVLSVFGKRLKTRQGIK